MDIFQGRNLRFMRNDVELVNREREVYSVALRKVKRKISTLEKREYQGRDAGLLKKYGLFYDNYWEITKELIADDKYLDLLSVLQTSRKKATQEFVLDLILKIFEYYKYLDYGILFTIAYTVKPLLSDTQLINKSLQVLSYISGQSTSLISELDITNIFFSNLHQSSALNVLINLSFDETNPDKILTLPFLDSISKEFHKTDHITKCKFILILSNLVTQAYSGINLFLNHKLFKEIIEIIDHPVLLLRQECSYLFISISFNLTGNQVKLIISDKLLEKISNALILGDQLLQKNYLEFCKKLPSQDINYAFLKQTIEKFCFDKNIILSELAEKIMETPN